MVADRRPSQVRNPFVFVVGCPRSGTTLLQRMLNSHPQLAVANDSHFIPRCLEKAAPAALEDAALGRDIPLTPELASAVSDYHRFRRLGLEEEAVQAARQEATTYQDYVAALYSRFAQANDKQLGGEKTPDYVRKLPLLHGLCPQAKTIHIIRDGRDTALSLLQWASESKGPGKLELWKAQPVAVSALWWRWQVQCGRDSGAALGSDHYHEIGYEALVADPEASLRKMSTFLGLPFSEGMLRYHEGKQKENPALSAKSAWLPPTAGLRRWQSQMEPRDIELFEALAGDLLDALGHERAFTSISPAVESLAVECRTWWDALRARREAKQRKRVAKYGQEAR